MRFYIKHYIAKGGERFSLLYSTDEPGIPLFYPTAYAARSLRMAKTHATQKVALESIRRLCEWERDRQTSVEAMLIAGELLSARAVDDLAAHVLARRTGKVDDVISSTKFNNYWLHINEYIEWLTDELLQNRNDLNTRKLVEDQANRLAKKTIKRAGSKARRNQKILEAKLSEIARAELLSIFQDPFKGLTTELYKATRLRNSVMLRILYETGMRRGELLALKLKNFVESSGGQSAHLVIERNHNDELDRRLNQPVAKTLGRTLPISEELEQQIIDYRAQYRAELRNVGHTEDSFIFCIHHSRAHEGAPLTINGFNSAFAYFRSCFPLIGETLHPHALRHDWNYRFSKKADELGLTETEENEARCEAMGWIPESKMARVYNQRHRKEKAMEVGRKIARDSERLAK